MSSEHSGEDNFTAVKKQTSSIQSKRGKFHKKSHSI